MPPLVEARSPVQLPPSPMQGMEREMPVPRRADPASSAFRRGYRWGWCDGLCPRVHRPFGSTLAITAPAAVLFSYGVFCGWTSIAETLDLLSALSLEGKVGE